MIHDAEIKKAIAIATNLDCLIFIGFGIKIAGGMASRPASFEAYMFLPPHLWTALYLSAGISGYFCLFLARYYGRSDLWRIWSMMIAAPLFAFSTWQFVQIPSSTGSTTYGALWLTRALKSFGYYESDVVVTIKRKSTG